MPAGVCEQRNELCVRIRFLVGPLLSTSHPCGRRGRATGDSALRRRYYEALKAADIAHLRFHDLRHTFGTRMIAKADVRHVQEWMGHADIQTTMKYLHYAPRAEDAALVAEAFGGTSADPAATGRADPT